MERVVLVLFILLVNQMSVSAANMLDYYHSDYSYCTKLRRSIIDLKVDTDISSYEIASKRSLKLMEKFKKSYFAYGCPNILRRRG